MKKNNKGFTLVEIMIVVAIIGILAAVAIPNFVKNRRESQKNACISNLKQIQGACEQILMRGEEVSADTLKEQIKGWDNLSCPANKTKKYEVPTGEEPVPTCPCGAEGHTLVAELAE